MKKLNLIIFGVLIIMLSSCSSDNDTTNTTNFSPKLLKQTTDNQGYWNKYFYNEQNELILITKTSNQISLDSTYLEYNNGSLSRVFQRIYVPVTGIVNTEINFSQFNSTLARGTYKVFLDDGTIFQDKTLEYNFSNNLIKAIKFFNLDGTKWLEKIFIHDNKGNLTNWNQLWYNSDGSIQTNWQYTFSEWDTKGLKTQSLFFWNYSIDILSNIYMSNNNCLNRIENGQTFRYSFEYDTEGNVTKYNSIDEQRFLTFEYYQ